MWSTTGAGSIPADNERGFTLIEVMIALAIMLMIILTWSRVFIIAGSLQERLEQQENFYAQGTILGQEIIANISAGAVLPACCQELTVEDLLNINFTFSQALALDSLQEIKIYFSLNQFFANQGRIYQLEISWEADKLDFFIWKII